MYQFPWFQVEGRLTNLRIHLCFIFKGLLLHPIIRVVTILPLPVYPSHHTGGRKTLSSMGEDPSKVFLKRSPEGHYRANFQDRVPTTCPWLFLTRERKKCVSALSMKFATKTLMSAPRLKTEWWVPLRVIENESPISVFIFVLLLENSRLNFMLLFLLVWKNNCSTSNPFI